MATPESMARAALDGDALLSRSMVQDLMADPRVISDLNAPVDAAPQLNAVAASLVELLATRAGVAAPDWTVRVPAAAEALFLLKGAAVMPRLRERCERESPGPLRKRNVFAPASYLEFA